MAPLRSSRSSPVLSPDRLKKYPGESAVGEAAAGSGCSSARSISSSYGMYYGYIGQEQRSSRRGDCGSSGPGPQDFPSDNATDADITKCNYVCKAHDPKLRHN
ncbi:hypothetical protein Tco_1044629 [Tanacetum coccineum]|uniref:Uncharacterized protein n=1 Tax=Tanacetum coccineum TaxID=301880 RepID=A0ABQ5GR14_9ASTR